MANIHFPEISTYRFSCNDPTKRFPVENPATGATLTTIQAGDSSTAEAAIQSSQQAFTEVWSSIPPQERSTYLLGSADALESHSAELATLLCLENGKPYLDALSFDIAALVNLFRYFGSLVGKMPSEFYDRGSTYCTVFHEPLGVCVGILPFNWPPIHAAGKMAPALAAGNTIVVKPGEQAPLTVFRIGEILETVLPKDVVVIVPGLGPEVPQALIKHELVKMVSFTGSTAAGAAVAKTAAESITKCVLELGGKNAFIVFEDADVEVAVRDALEGAFFNKGEACTATSRILVQEQVYDAFVEKLAAAVKKIRAGNGMKEGVHVGPQVSRAQQKKVLDYIELGKKEGARVAAQASLPSDPECRDGFFAPATLFADVTEDMRIAQEEMFGTIVTVTKFSTLSDAIRITNSVPYGLTAAIYTRDSLRANRVTRALQTGMVFVNTYQRGVLGTPFGGVKHSGYGREHCIETLREWTAPKAVHSVSGMGTLRSWRVVDEIFGKGKL